LLLLLLLLLPLLPLLLPLAHVLHFLSLLVLQQLLWVAAGAWLALQMGLLPAAAVLCA
jgi:hypothetical protein